MKKLYGVNAAIPADGAVCTCKLESGKFAFLIYEDAKDGAAPMWREVLTIENGDGNYTMIMGQNGLPVLGERQFSFHFVVEWEQIH